MRLRNIQGARDAIEESPLVVHKPEKAKGNWRELFGNTNPIRIEIGMGKGKFIHELAGRNPDINYVGIEKYSSVLLRALQKMDAEMRENLLFIRMAAEAIVEVFGDSAHKLNISSTKSMTGHLLGATGALEAMFSVKAVQEDIVPPTINHEEGDEDEEIDYSLNFTFNRAQKREVRAALSNAFGFGGHNATVIVKKFRK